MSNMLLIPGHRATLFTALWGCFRCIGGVRHVTQAKTVLRKQGDKSHHGTDQHKRVATTHKEESIVNLNSDKSGVSFSPARICPITGRGDWWVLGGGVPHLGGGLGWCVFCFVFGFCVLLCCCLCCSLFVLFLFCLLSCCFDVLLALASSALRCFALVELRG